MQLSIKMISIYPLAITNYNFISTHYDIKKLSKYVLLPFSHSQINTPHPPFFHFNNPFTPPPPLFSFSISLALSHPILSQSHLKIPCSKSPLSS